MLLLFLVLVVATSPSVARNDGEVTPFDYLCLIGVVDQMYSKFQANLVTLSAVIPGKASASGGFFTGSSGAAPHTVYGLALCRGDIVVDDAAGCSACLQAVVQNATELCSGSRDVTVFYDQCQVRFSNTDFLAETKNEPTRTGWSADNITVVVPMFSGWDPDDGLDATFAVATVLVLLQETARTAAYSRRMFATAIMDAAGGAGAFPTLYSMAQCTPDQPQDGCFACLQDTVRKAHSRDLYRRQGGRVLGIRCSFRYETFSFYSGSPMRIFGPSLQHGQRSNHSKRRIIGVVISLFALLVCFPIGFGWMRWHRKGKVGLHNKSAVDMHQEEALVWTTMEGNVSSAFQLFDFAQIQEATCNFSPENKLGQGGFGPVYKGNLPDGMEIAVKRLSRNSGQGFVEFKNEVQLIAKLQHTNLVRLLGYCIQGQEKMLVYEYLPNKSLDLYIYDTLEKRALLDWKRRLTIIQGIAQGLLYLHKHSRLRIIHRDLKASNILLDLDMNPKISDFGIAKIFISNDVEDNTNTVIGTYGYMAPEYASDGFFSSKFDVFSFGVLLLEIVSGKRNSVVGPYGGLINLLGYAWLLWKEGKWHELVDKSLVIENGASSELFKCTNIALLCVQENAADRPTMWDVTTMLSTEGASLPDPKHPAYYNVNVVS